MQISNKVFAASMIGAGAAVAVTQNAAISVTAPVAIPASVMQWVLPIVMALVPILLQNFAPGLLPFWEWLKGKLPLPAELAEYQKAANIKSADPACPLLHRKAKAMIDATFERYHPAPAKIGFEMPPAEVPHAT